ncbi:MAG: hypothetical protein H0T42_11325 [Deltaproteobacteria bacterium]|nr:hypothetical protein [Deltaproteobacteria bacterium]
MRQALVLCMFLAGCDRWQTCEDLIDWNIPVSRDGSDEGADAHVTRAPDGTIVLAISDPFSAVQFGDRRLQGAHLAKVSTDGVIEQVVPVSAPSQYASIVRADALGNVVIAWGGSATTVIGYGADLQQRWSRVAGQGSRLPLDVAPSGQIALATTTVDAGQAMVSLLNLDPDGQTRWERLVGNESIFILQIADNGDVFSFNGGPGGMRRTRHAASDGAVLEQLAISTPPQLTLPDGGFFQVGYNPDGSASALLTRFASDGREMWSRTRDVRALVNPILTTSGDVVAQTSYEAISGPTYRLLVVDGETGEDRNEVSMCTYQSIFAADAEHYFGLGLIGSPSIGLARFAMP